MGSLLHSLSQKSPWVRHASLSYSPSIADCIFYHWGEGQLGNQDQLEEKWNLSGYFAADTPTAGAATVHVVHLPYNRGRNIRMH